MTKTLRADLARRLPTLYDQARRQLIIELERIGVVGTAARLPPDCRYTLQQVIGDWWPEQKRSGPRRSRSGWPEHRVD